MRSQPANSFPCLLPAPRSCSWRSEWFEYGRAVDVLTSTPAWLHCETIDDPAKSHDPCAEQGYSLEITTGGVHLRFTGEPGRRHGLATLAQIVRCCPQRMPTGVIEDAPAFAVRGVMLDISRDRVPTMETLHDTIDVLASLKINHLQLYMEHTFAYAGHEDVWRDASPLTSKEVRSLDSYCRSRGIELAANQNCFGHMHHWLKHDRYAHLAETTGDWDFNGFPRSGPFSLCPLDPGSIALVRDLLAQLLPCFSSPLVNIGCDETFDVGQGRSRNAVNERGQAVVFAEYVAQVAALVRDGGRRPMFWADMALKHEECVEMLPDDMIVLDWGYEPDWPFGEHGAKLETLGREHWVCPGTSTWRTFTGRTTERTGNLHTAARAGLAHGAHGYLVTDWGDLGHRQQWPLSLYGLAEGAHSAWCGDDSTRPFDPATASIHVFRDPTETVGPWLHALGDADRSLRDHWHVETTAPDQGGAKHLHNASALFVDLNERVEGTAFGSMDHWLEARDGLLTLADTIPPGKRYYDELQHAAQTALFAARRAIARRQPGGLKKDERRTLAVDLESLIKEYRRLWHLRSRLGGLEDSCAHFVAVLNDLRSTGPT